MYSVRVLEPHFCIGTQHYPEGSEIEVNDIVGNYLLREGKAERVTEGYTRRDMQAEGTSSSPAKRTRKKRSAK